MIKSKTTNMGGSIERERATMPFHEAVEHAAQLSESVKMEIERQRQRQW